MGGRLSAIIANIYMEDFENNALDLAEHKPTHWIRYVDDILAVWPHGDEKLQNFLQFLNQRHPNHLRERHHAYGVVCILLLL